MSAHCGVIHDQRGAVHPRVLHPIAAIAARTAISG
jgi:hypothetical protein